MLVNPLEYSFMKTATFKHKLRTGWNLDFCITKEFIIFKSVTCVSELSRFQIITEDHGFMFNSLFNSIYVHLNSFNSHT